MDGIAQAELGELAVRIGASRAACRLVALAARELEAAITGRPGERMEVLEGMDYVLSTVIENLGEIQNALTQQ